MIQRVRPFLDSRFSAVFQRKLRQELQSYKDEVERLSAKLKQCAEHGKGSKETWEKSMAGLAQKHEQTKAVLSKSQHRELELQAQIAEVQECPCIFARPVVQAAGRECQSEGRSARGESRGFLEDIPGLTLFRSTFNSSTLGNHCFSCCFGFWFAALMLKTETYPRTP